MLQVGAGVVLDVGPQAIQHGAVGQHRLQADHEFARHAVADDAIAAGIGRDVAADGAAAARAQVEREHQPERIELFLQRLQHHARLHGGHRAVGVDRLDRRHAFHRQHDFTGLRQLAQHQPGAAALGRHRNAGGVADGERARHLLRVRRTQHGKRRLAPPSHRVHQVALFDLGAAHEAAFAQLLLECFQCLIGFHAAPCG